MTDLPQSRIGSSGPQRPDAGTTDRAALRDAAKQFEAVFLRQMIAAMRSATLADPVLGSDAANQFRDIADARLADSMAGRFGIAAMLEQQLGK